MNAGRCENCWRPKSACTCNRFSSWERPWAPLDPRMARIAEAWFALPDGWEERATTEQPRGLLVGEQPGAASNPRLPLWPYPENSAGGRLRRMSCVPHAEYLVRLARVNLARRPTGRWDPEGAQGRAYALACGLAGTGCRVVACGARARDAFGAPSWFERWTVVAPYRSGRQLEVVAIPHPSGRNHEYNHAATRSRAGQVVRWAAGLEEWSST